MKALAMKALVKSTAAKCLVKVFAAVNAATTVKDPSTAVATTVKDRSIAMEAAAAVLGIGR